MPEPKIYPAQILAAERMDIKALSGTRRAAQRYVDRITASDWWSDHCPGFWTFSEPPPRRVWVWEDKGNEGGMLTNEVTIHKGEEFPTIILGQGEAIQTGTPAIADKWVILHELAHVMSTHFPSHHGKEFCLDFLLLVNQWMGNKYADVLLDSCRQLKVRMNYRLAESLILC